MNNSKIVLINKKSGISSFKRIRDVQKEYGFDKIGHAGTLDPLAEGLLIAMSNKATKLSDDLMKKDKVYELKMKLGFETDTLDLEGEVVNEGRSIFPKEDITKAIMSFKGEIKQVPPMYSAIKINGVKMYELARKNKKVDIPARDIKIYDIYDININGSEISFKCFVSSGTYIRSLVRDIAYKLNTYATMTYLKRIRIGSIDCVEDVKLLDVPDLIQLDKIMVSKEEYERLKNGQTLKYKYLGRDNKLHCYVNDEYVGILDVLHKKDEIVSIRKSKFFENK